MILPPLASRPNTLTLPNVAYVSLRQTGSVRPVSKQTPFKRVSTLAVPVATIATIGSIFTARTLVPQAGLEPATKEL